MPPVMHSTYGMEQAKLRGPYCTNTAQSVLPTKVQHPHWVLECENTNLVIVKVEQQTYRCVAHNEKQIELLALLELRYAGHGTVQVYGSVILYSGLYNIYSTSQCRRPEAIHWKRVAVVLSGMESSPHLRETPAHKAEYAQWSCVCVCCACSILYSIVQVVILIIVQCDDDDDVISDPPLYLPSPPKWDMVIGRHGPA